VKRLDGNVNSPDSQGKYPPGPPAWFAIEANFLWVDVLGGRKRAPEW